MDAASDKLLEELRTLVTAAEKLLGASPTQGGERLDELRTLAEEQVRRHPLAALAIAAALGVALGALLARK
jgi:ElaB/YqjD/DUF883 family membrane-anchored ribosome-binding protein